MSGLRSVVSIGGMLLLALMGSVAPIQAASVCGPRDNPATCAPAFDANAQLAIKRGVPFVWLRKDASSTAAVAHTVNYSSKARFVIEYSPSVYDGYQNWWLVHLVSDKSKGGWVEQSSLVDANVTMPQPPPHADWTASFAGGIRAGVPFAWVRNAANSSAGVLFTLFNGDPFIVLTDPPPVYDGRQWWWYITAPVPTFPKGGYVEQASIVERVDNFPTSVPTNVADTPAPTCGTMTVTPSRPGYTAGIYYVKPGSDLTFHVDGLANLASITFKVPSSASTVWRDFTEPRKLDFPGVQAEVYLTAPQAYGWASVSAEAVGLNGQTIQCGSFWIEDTNNTGTTDPSALSGDPNAPAVTPDPSSGY